MGVPLAALYAVCNVAWPSAKPKGLCYLRPRNLPYLCQVGLGARGISWLPVPEEAYLCAADISLLLVPAWMVWLADSYR